MERKKILIADDQVEILQILVKQLGLSHPEFQLINASNGEVAITIAQEVSPSLILMDWDMPVMNGIVATRHLRQIAETHDTPIIITTGRMTSSEDLTMALEAGATDFIRKPFDFLELTARINTALRIKAQHDAIQKLLKNEIELKNRKLSTTSMLIVEKNHLLRNFYNGLERLEKSLDDPQMDAKKEVKQMKKQAKSHIDIDSSWETFKLHFDEVHPNFFQELQEKFSSISQRDLKLCAYLRIGMDNKQIAHLLNITPASMRTALFRLKKKLALAEEIELRTFIMKL